MLFYALVGEFFGVFIASAESFRSVIAILQLHYGCWQPAAIIGRLRLTSISRCEAYTLLELLVELKIRGVPWIFLSKSGIEAILKLNFVGGVSRA